MISATLLILNALVAAVLLAHMGCRNRSWAGSLVDALSRTASEYGVSAASALARQLPRSGFVDDAGSVTVAVSRHCRWVLELAGR